MKQMFSIEFANFTNWDFIEQSASFEILATKNQITYGDGDYSQYDGSSGASLQLDSYGMIKLAKFKFGLI